MMIHVDWRYRFARCQVWIPLTWRRSNMVFSSYVVGLFGLFILEFSLWNNFGNYIWYVSIGFTILDMVIGDIVSYQLKEVRVAFLDGGIIICVLMTNRRRPCVPGVERTPQGQLENVFSVGWHGQGNSTSLIMYGQAGRPATSRLSYWLVWKATCSKRCL